MLYFLRETHITIYGTRRNVWTRWDSFNNRTYSHFSIGINFLIFIFCFVFPSNLSLALFFSEKCPLSSHIIQKCFCCKYTHILGYEKLRLLRLSDGWLIVRQITYSRRVKPGVWLPELFKDNRVRHTYYEIIVRIRNLCYYMSNKIGKKLSDQSLLAGWFTEWNVSFIM